MSILDAPGWDAISQMLDTDLEDSTTEEHAISRETFVKV